MLRASKTNVRLFSAWRNFKNKYFIKKPENIRVSNKLNL